MHLAAGLGGDSLPLAIRDLTNLEVFKIDGLGYSGKHVPRAWHAA